MDRIEIKLPKSWDVVERFDVPLKNDAMGFIEELIHEKCPRIGMNWILMIRVESALIQDYPIKTLLKMTIPHWMRAIRVSHQNS